MRGAVCSSSQGPDGLVTSLGEGRFSGHGPFLPVRQSTTLTVTVLFSTILLQTPNMWQKKLMSVLCRMNEINENVIILNRGGGYGQNTVVSD